ncbi:MAG: cellulose synthase operon protein YhjQ/BcsQ [Planctomycetota bacterium]|nr:cellulose synthase operon protein YhjQ/BcsQ [Planctomycetota bacterium]MDP6762847.1 cellulose synthase operon protein YhjQ/BcsQ [Planctomycetota bacterium]MDP6990434.1 cellulose synthase operon protein YhjQ/BcsQ [Planctomycetota bacterium]
MDPHGGTVGAGAAGRRDEPEDAGEPSPGGRPSLRSLAREALHRWRAASSGEGGDGEADRYARLRAGSICVAGGKGGTGKSVVCAALGSLLSYRGPTLLLDADFGMGNAHLLQGVEPGPSFADFLRGEIGLEGLLVTGREGLDLIPVGHGALDRTELSAFEMHRIATGLERLETGYEHLLVDLPAGASDQTLALASASDVVLLVTNHENTALMDTYAFYKMLSHRRPGVRPLLVVNRVESAELARDTQRRLASVSERYLGRSPRMLGWIPEDRRVRCGLTKTTPIVEREPASPAAIALTELAAKVADELAGGARQGLGRTLLRRVGYSPKSG